MKTLTNIFTAILLMASPFAFTQTKNTPANIVIVHGSWSSAADWDAVAVKLKSEGNQVAVINLPGHGDDQSAVSGISLQGYIDAVKKAISGKKEIVLVGHSFGGIVTSAVAEQAPGQIKKLIYLAAYVPQNGESLLTIANTDADSRVGKFLQIDEKKGIAGIAKAGIAGTFLADAPKGVQDYVTEHLRAEPLAPLATPVTLSAANFGQTVKVYIHTYNDKVNSFNLQQKMVRSAGITRVYGLPSSHTPFVSMPNTLAAIISGEANQ